MIYKLFTGMINKGLTASVVIVAVLLARLFLGRLPKKYSYFLWIIVGIRLICPFGISSSLSVFNLIGEHTVLDASSPLSAPEYAFHLEPVFMAADEKEDGGRHPAGRPYL